MPGFDRTGPGGMGPMTGGGRGLCNPAGSYRRFSPGFRGSVWYNRGYAAPAQPDFDRMEMEGLKNQTEALKKELQALERQIENLSGEK